MIDEETRKWAQPWREALPPHATNCECHACWVNKMDAVHEARRKEIEMHS